MKTLQKAVPLLGLAQLRDFGAQQTQRLEKIQQIIGRGQTEIDKVKADMEPYMTGGVRRVGNVQVRASNPADSALKSQVITKQFQIRQTINAEVRPIYQKMVASKILAKEYATRHWTKIQVLNRASTGTITDSLARRAHYALIFAKAGKAQLSDFGQLAIDTGDAVLADAVYRAVASMPTDARPFVPAAILELVPNAEWSEAQAVLESVVNATDRAKMVMDRFDGGRHGAVDKINLGLEEQSKSGADDFNIDDVLDSAGGIKDSALPLMGKRISGQ